MNERLKSLADAGVSIWLDDLSRERITRATWPIWRPTTQSPASRPTRRSSPRRLPKVTCTTIRSRLMARNADLHDAIKVLTTDDVRNACDIMAASRRPTASTAASPSRSIRIWPTRPTPPRPRPPTCGRSSTDPTY